MIDKQKIRIMTNLSIYDKGIGVKDKEKNEMLQFDYVYKSNFLARVSAFFGCLIILAFYVVKLIFVEQVDLFNFDYKGEVTKIIYIVVAVLVIYTIINGIAANIEYMKSQKRLSKYYRLLDALDERAKNPHPAARRSKSVSNEDNEAIEEEAHPKDRYALNGYTPIRRVSDREFSDDDDEIPANKYPDTRTPKSKSAPPPYSRTSAYRTPAPRTSPYNKPAQINKPPALRGSRATPNLSVNKGAVKGKDGKFTSD